MDTETISSVAFYAACILCVLNSLGIDAFIAELSEASTVLSQRAVYADMFGFKHTMNNFNHNEVAKAKSRLLGRLIQVQGVNHLPKIFPCLVKRAEQSLEEQLTLGKVCSDGISLPVACTVRALTSRVMGVLFFGEKISSDPIFASALLRYPKEMVLCMVAFQVTPSFLSSSSHSEKRYVHGLITKQGDAQTIILKRLAHIMGAGRDAWDEDPAIRELTFAWNIASIGLDSEYWNGPEHLAQTLLGVWFAAAHQPWMNLDFLLLQLCRRPDTQEALRQEIGTLEGLNYAKLMDLPFLDSFIKETVRLHPLDKLAVRRKALQPYTFASGSPQIPAGATVAVSSYDLMHNSTDYPSPDDFQPRRFMDKGSPVRGTKFTEVSDRFPIWGYGSLACPGRFHASIVMKLVIAQFVMRYDMKLEDENARTFWSWETFIMPYESTRLIPKERVSTS
ncbi:cytochrome P450 [Periconia macrospinosa]|uniref:Cytochrome P450 n=1 Tax=Periconia macrospinosa TaxID=97972 RepID=A0A2V1D2C8_9PLEO|nr:cytochrome P450 [Periconia macrospinosa]